MNKHDRRHDRLAKLQGLKFGMLTVLKYNNDGTWQCKCDCGNIVNKTTWSIQRSPYANCGCVRVCKGNTKHNLCYERLYGIYEKMKGRCFTPTDAGYKNYGGRGVKIADVWLGKNGFINFHDWAINNGYSNELTIDRINVDGDYEPSNCRWVNQKTQQNNRRNNRRITYNAQTHTIAEWANIKDIPYDRLQARIAHGWSIEDALNTPKMANKYTEYKED